MTKREFTERLAKKLNAPYAEAEKLLNATLASLEDALFRDGRVALRGLGTFECYERLTRAARNPQTGEALTTPACRAARFRPCAELKNRLRGN